MTERPQIPTPEQLRSTSRRDVLRTAGLVALSGGAVLTLAACGADADSAGPSVSTSAAPTSGSATPSASASASESASATPKASATTQAPSGPSVATSEVSVGGGSILENADYVVTQPTKGDFKAFSKICTHRQCPVTSVSNGVINCNCHGSEFSIKDGSVVKGPATQALAEAKTTVSGSKVYVTG